MVSLLKRKTCRIKSAVSTFAREPVSAALVQRHRDNLHIQTVADKVQEVLLYKGKVNTCVVKI